MEDRNIFSMVSTIYLVTARMSSGIFLSGPSAQASRKEVRTGA